MNLLDLLGFLILLSSQFTSSKFILFRRNKENRTPPKHQLVISLSLNQAVKVNPPPGGVYHVVYQGRMFQLSNPILSFTGEIMFCPESDQFIYLPYQVDPQHVHYVKTDQSHWMLRNLYPHCYGILRIEGLPQGVGYRAVVNGESKLYHTPSITVLILSDSPVSWRLEDVLFGDRVYSPERREGKLGRGQSETVRFILSRHVPPPSSPPPSTHPDLPPVRLTLSSEWDPMKWVGREIYGYEVISVVGRGGNGYVLKARMGERYYAIKVLSLTPSNNATLVARSTYEDLYKESDNLKRLSKHPAFVEIFGIYLDSNLIARVVRGDEETYLRYPPAIVMEFMEGGSVDRFLSDEMINQSSYWPLIVKTIMREMAKALAFLHSSGYVHLDVKPQNIFLRKEPGRTGEEAYRDLQGNLKLGDLGTTVRIGERVMQATPSYCPPEQVEAIVTGKGASPEMDVFALGMTGYRLLTLRDDNPASQLLDEAFNVAGDRARALGLVERARESLTSWRPVVEGPPELRDVIVRALSVQPERRPKAHEIAIALR
ncbi:Serine/threonine-protein kinase ArnS [Metallosphaera sp. J1]|uniref:serine/threonine-protein kinase n=1 Tax=Metallosphaera javensis (ex Hofmann et al. 2022) TaxID=99938 RepID=UPI001EE13E54|nr:serine/threonine-protein kinase [Metallosphaera javensis (ex Hofmann et al. 2022)]MCG3109213.1 Serine/threonine-protein kinase ArnS [Metallosphaera javensis (ex Hofmann et al. 2022)]